jgi:hypothetical protein
LGIILNTQIGPTLYGKISELFNAKAETTYFKGMWDKGKFKDILVRNAVVTTRAV